MDSFLLIGQSNMSGRGRMAEVPPICDPRIRMFRDGRWVPAEEPLHTDKPAIAGIGLGMSFVAELLAHGAPGPIGLIPCAVGGTPLRRWMPGADLYETAVAVADAALQESALAGILWHQGEGDSNSADTAGDYGERFERMIRALRARLSGDATPVIAGELGGFLAQRDGLTFAGEINCQLRALEGRLPRYGLAGAEGLTDNGDHLHFNAVSLREFGRRYAARYLEVVRPDSGT